MRIIGTGSAVPHLRINNNELSEFLDTSDEWIRTRTGIIERRILTDEPLEDLAAQACMQALEQAGLTAGQIDYILCSNVINSYVTPALSCIVQGKIGAACPCLDLNGACAGFLYALEMAEAYLKMGKCHHILVVAAECPSRMVNWQDRATCVLFGDGAAAAVVSAGGEDPAFRMFTSCDTQVLHSHHASGNCPYVSPAIPASPLHMNGQEVYKFAVSRATEDIRALCAEQGLELCRIGHFILHQANLRILEAVRTRLKQPPEKFPHNVEKYGNTSSAGIAILLDELNRNGTLENGEYLAMSAFGAGLTSGACILKWDLQG